MEITHTYFKKGSDILESMSIMSDGGYSPNLVMMHPTTYYKNFAVRIPRKLKKKLKRIGAL